TDGVGTAGAAQAQENAFMYERVKYLDVEIKVIDGQPMFVYETEKGYEKIPFSMSDLGNYAYANGQKVPLKTQGNNILVQTEEGLVAVPIEEFDVVMVDGQIVLTTEENPVKFVPVAVAIAALKKAGVAITSTTIKATAVLIAAGKRVTARSVDAVVRAMPTIRKALGAIGKVTNSRISWMHYGAAYIDWTHGICANPYCVNRTPDGRFGDILCADCADKVGRQFYGPKS
ncbi:hypothetical protein M1N70_03455, partial [Peptococcaceae bacterium]|nr:hypothetical protein [Peptococcaceae bacterium]